MSSRRASIALLAAALALLPPTGCATKNAGGTKPKVGPAANFIALPTAGNSPMDVDFTNQSTSGTSAITSFLWDFGDGGTSTASNPFYVYSAPGTYSVTLTVTTADGTSTRTRDDYVVVGNGPGTTPPNAVFSALPTAGNPPLTVNFTDQSTAGTSPITAWAWTFGDGGTSSAQNPSHVYAANGAYTVKLAVTTAVGTDTGTKPNFIVASPSPVGPTAAFTGSPTDGYVPLTVNFTDQSAPGSGTITSRSWSFGDGGASTAANPTHVYSAAGNYTVSLTATTSVGSNTVTKPGYITVRPTPASPTAQFTGTPRTGAAPLFVQFTDQSAPGTSPITDWSWNFGDGQTSIAQSPGHTYAAAGSYTVSLTVTSADGSNTITKAAYVTPCATPAADFTANQTTGLAPLPVSFTDLTTGAPTSWSWTFGDGGTSTASAPNHTYTTPGTYTVSLTAGNACGSDTNTKVGYVTVQDPCPNPVYSVTAASWTNITPGADPGYRTRGRLTWNTQVSVGCSRSVFARIYVRPVGTTVWTLFGASPCYPVSGSKANNPYSMFLQGLAKDCYDIRVAVYECGTTVEKASREPADDPDLSNQCFEP